MNRITGRRREVKDFMKKGFRWNKKGISTVIATIIIVAISIVMAIAVAYWAMGIGGSFTRFEKLQFTSSYATPATGGWLITINVKNTGTAAATISDVFLNGQPSSTYATPLPVISPTPTTGPTIATLTAGGQSTITVKLDNTEKDAGGNLVWTSGMSVELRLQTAAGNSYPTTVQLP